MNATTRTPDRCFAVPGESGAVFRRPNSPLHTASASGAWSETAAGTAWRPSRARLKTRRCGAGPMRRALPKPGTLTPPRTFNLMFETHVGAMRDASSIAYLRPETAQGIFVNFKAVCDTSRVRIPFGIGQIGKAFRNEINPRNFTFRSREFEQMEIEFFCAAEHAGAWYRYWRDRRFQWYVDLGLGPGQAHVARARYRRTGPLRCVLRRRRIRVPLRRQRTGRHRQPHRFRPRPAHERQRQGSSLFRRSAGGPRTAALSAARHRAFRRRRPGHARVSVRRLRRGSGQRR